MLLFDWPNGFLRLVALLEGDDLALLVLDEELEVNLHRSLLASRLLELRLGGGLLPRLRARLLLSEDILVRLALLLGLRLQLALCSVLAHEHVDPRIVRQHHRQRLVGDGELPSLAVRLHTVALLQ